MKANKVSKQVKTYQRRKKNSKAFSLGLQIGIVIVLLVAGMIVFANVLLVAVQ